ncbi:hypothetical protein EON63_05320 [archaeon]|nr:MAG: hypothetical protein EON63_05320 [archaeon]
MMVYDGIIHTHIMNFITIHTHILQAVFPPLWVTSPPWPLTWVCCRVSYCIFILDTILTSLIPYAYVCTKLHTPYTTHHISHTIHITHHKP